MSKVMSYKMGDFIRKQYEDKIEKPKDIGMILKPGGKGEGKLEPGDIWSDIETKNMERRKQYKKERKK
jgi:hypothetical protein